MNKTFGLRVATYALAFGSVLPLWSQSAPQSLAVRVLSSRPDMVSGGDALVEITTPGNAAPQKITATVDGRDVTAAFRRNPSGRALIGRLEGLKSGSNTLEVSAGGQRRIKLDLVNHPIPGPIFSGPHQTPFICQTEAAGLGPSLDADCSIKTVVTYMYKSTQPPARPAAGQPAGPAPLPAGFKLFDPSDPHPADMAKTTTSDGRTVDYIVRRETGTINRGLYQIAFLHQPGQPLPDPWAGTPGWNGRLIYAFGAGCRPGYRQGLVNGAVNDIFLSQGYAVAASSLSTFGNNCDDVISAETMMMVKEYFIKTFGVPVHTIGSGGSGGSMQQYLIAQNYPGLLDGIMPERSYSDMTTEIPPTVDCALLARAFANGSAAWTDEQKTAVAGFATWRSCSDNWLAQYAPDFVVATSKDNRPCDRSIPQALIYDSAGNRSGARCDLYDNEVNVYGRDPSTGFARRPLDNVGVQYGLGAFNAGQISAVQFVELNEHAGGFDIDGNLVATRTVADPAALRTAYQTGRVDSGGGSLATIPIVDIRNYVDPTGNIHDRVRSFQTRARLVAANGNADNQAMLVSPAPPTGNILEIDPVRMAQIVRLMDQWLDAIAKDGSQDSAAIKVARNRPHELADGCWTPDGERIYEPQVYDQPTRCNTLYPPHADPRLVAGAPLAGNILKCALKPLDRKDYKQPVTNDQMARLKAVFPQGVCDYSRPGIEQHPLADTWRKY